MLYFFLIVDVISIFVLLRAFFADADFIKLSVLSAATFFCIYTIASGLLFLFDVFSFVRAVGGAACVLVPSAACCIWRYRVDFKGIIFWKGNDLVPVGIVLFIGVLTVSKYELFGTGQDQGLYQAEAIELYMGNYEVQHDFEEYQILEKEEDRAAYYNMLDDVIVGYYPLSGSDWVSEKNYSIDTEVSGMYHGIQTFPALLALGGKLFGLNNMVQIQSLFFICAVFMLCFAMQNLGIRQSIYFPVVFLMIFSPLVVWISKTSFTEMFLTMLVAFYLMLLTETGSGIKRYLLSLPLVAFSFSHISFLIIYPIFVLAHIVLYLYQSDREYLGVNIITAVGLSVGYYMMARIAPEYFYMNCAGMYFADIITSENLLIWIMSGAFAVCAVSFLIMKLPYSGKAYSWCIKAGCFMPVVIIALIGIQIVHGIKIGFFAQPYTVWVQYYGTGVGALQHLALYAFAMALGFIIVPYLIYKMITCKKALLEEPALFSVYLLFIYTVLAQSAFFRKEVNYYYYYSRYLVFYIPIFLLLLSVFLQRENKWVRGLVAGVALCAMLPFDYSLVTEKSDTMLEWETLEDLATAVEPDSAVIIESSEIQSLVAVQLRAMTDAAVFPVFEDRGDQIELLRKHYTHIYYLSDSEIDRVSELYADNFEMVYRDHYEYSVYPADPLGGVYPTRADKMQKELMLYQFLPDTVYASVDIAGGAVGVINGERGEDFVQTTGVAGIVLYGPYIDMPAGEYYLKMPVEIESGGGKLDGICSIGVSGGDVIVEPVDLNRCLVTEGDQQYIKVPFRLENNISGLEFVISAGDHSVFRLYSYTVCYDMSD